MQEGNDFHKLLIVPATKKLLTLKTTDLVLDVACGNGLSLNIFKSTRGVGL